MTWETLVLFAMPFAICHMMKAKMNPPKEVPSHRYAIIFKTQEAHMNP